MILCTAVGDLAGDEALRKIEALASEIQDRRRVVAASAAVRLEDTARPERHHARARDTYVRGEARCWRKLAGAIGGAFCQNHWQALSLSIRRLSQLTPAMMSCSDISWPAVHVW